jgi:alpha-L-fucosidase
MKMHKIFILVILIIARLAPFAQQNNNTADSVAVLQAQALKQTEQKKGYFNDHPGAQWFPKAGLGLFIHWGMAAVSGVGDLSWSMLANKPWKDHTLTPNVYYALAGKWDPSKMDFEKILKGAKAAGIT